MICGVRERIIGRFLIVSDNRFGRFLPGRVKDLVQFLESVRFGDLKVVHRILPVAEFNGFVDLEAHGDERSGRKGDERSHSRGQRDEDHLIRLDLMFSLLGVWLKLAKIKRKLRFIRLFEILFELFLKFVHQNSPP